MRLFRWIAAETTYAAPRWWWALMWLYIVVGALTVVDILLGGPLQ